MNIYQRIILIAGAIALVIVLLTTPRYVIFQGDRFVFTKAMNRHKHFGAEKKTQFYPMTDIRAIGTRIGIAIGATVLIYFAAGKRKGKRGESNG